MKNSEKEITVSFYRPQLPDLWFRQKLLSDEKSMSYNHSYGGTIDFPAERWESWYQKWLGNDDSHYFYRYVVNTDNEYVGEAAYHYEQDRCMIDVLILDSCRHKGYGSMALKLLEQTAAENGIDKVCDSIACDNPSLVMFLKNGYEVEYDNEEYVMISKNIKNLKG